MNSLPWETVPFNGWRWACVLFAGVCISRPINTHVRHTARLVTAAPHDGSLCTWSIAQPLQDWRVWVDACTPIRFHKYVVASCCGKCSGIATVNSYCLNIAIINVVSEQRVSNYSVSGVLNQMEADTTWTRIRTLIGTLFSSRGK